PGDEGRRGPPCRPRRGGRGAHPAAADPDPDGRRLAVDEAGRLPALNTSIAVRWPAGQRAQPCSDGVASFRPTMPATIRPMHTRRAAVAGSLNTTMPSSAVPTAPMPTHTA